MSLRAGVLQHVTCFADVRSFTEHEALGVTPQSLRDVLADELARYGRDVRVGGPDLSRRTVASDTLSVIVQLRPTADVSYESLSLSVLSALNKRARSSDADVGLFEAHMPAGYAGAAILVTPVALPLVLAATVANYLSGAAREGGIVEVPRPFTFVVDESSWAEGAIASGAVPPATSSFVGRVLSAPNTIASADAARDGRTNGSVGVEQIKDGAAAGAAGAVLPPWVVPVAVAAAVVVGIAVVGYSARGVADVLRET